GVRPSGNPPRGERPRYRIAVRTGGHRSRRFRKRMKTARDHSPYKASQFEKQIPAKTYAKLQEHLYKFRGFYVQNRTVRSYPDSIAAQFLGYIQEVNDRDIE